MDRTDWYAYRTDKYGSTVPNLFNTRQSPRELFDEDANDGCSLTNEQMFRVGIPLEKIKAIVCGDMGILPVLEGDLQPASSESKIDFKGKLIDSLILEEHEAM